MTHQTFSSDEGRGRDVPEWSIQAARELCGIAHESAFVSIPRVNQFPLYGQNPTIHHVARGNTIRASFGVGKSHIGKTFDRRVGVDRSVFVEDTTMAVRGIFAKTDVTGDVKRRV